MYPRAARADDTKCLFAGISCKPSDGLEPSTPSLPWRFWVGISGHGSASAGTFSLQIGKSLCVADVRACPRVLSLLYPSRTRVMLSILKTDNAWLNDQ